MHTVYLRHRLTHRYVGTHQHEDQWQDAGVLRLTPPVEVSPPGGKDGCEMSDGGAYVRFARIPAGLDRRDRKGLVQAVRDTLTREGCAHEYDCCGCRSESTWRVTLRGRQLRAVTSVGYNY